MRERVRAWAGSRRVGFLFAAHAALPAAQPTGGGHSRLAGGRASKQEGHAGGQQHQPHNRRPRRVAPLWDPQHFHLRWSLIIAKKGEKRLIYQ
jgi:hypothetical protein